MTMSVTVAAITNLHIVGRAFMLRDIVLENKIQLLWVKDN